MAMQVQQYPTCQQGGVVRVNIGVARDASGEKLWKRCPHCSYQTRFQGNLNSHITVMHSYDRRRTSKFENFNYYKCNLCPYGSEVKQRLKNHMLARHTERTNSLCPKCGSKFKNDLCLRSHLQYCGKNEVHRCDFCSFKTRYKGHLKRHLLNVHSDNKYIECPHLCGSILKNKESLRTHLIFCGSQNFSIKCNYCSFRPKHVKLLKLHVARVHIDVNNIANECPTCARRFKKVSYLQRHIKRCDSKKIFQCAACSYKNYKKVLLEKHILKEHLNVTVQEDKIALVFHCPRCDSVFKTQAGLSEHLIRCGDNVGFQCYHCPFKAKIKDHLKNHILCAHIQSNELYRINMTNFFEKQTFYE